MLDMGFSTMVLLAPLTTESASVAMDASRLIPAALASPNAFNNTFLAALATEQTSSSTTSSINLSRAGSNKGMKGATSAGSRTNRHILSMTRAAFRFNCEVFRFRMTLPNKGAMSANVAESTFATKVVSNKLFNVFSVKKRARVVDIWTERSTGVGVVGVT